MAFYYEQEALACIADLGLGDLKFKWEFVHAKYVDVRRKWVGSHQTLADGTHHIKVAMQYGDDKERIDTVFHELRHAWQFARGVAKERPTGRLDWTGTKFIGPRMNYARVRGKAYRWMAHEVDARGYAIEAYLRLVELAGTNKKVIAVPTSPLRLMFDKSMEVYK